MLGAMAEACDGGIFTEGHEFPADGGDVGGEFRAGVGNVGAPPEKHAGVQRRAADRRHAETMAAIEALSRTLDALNRGAARATAGLQTPGPGPAKRSAVNALVARPATSATGFSPGEPKSRTAPAEGLRLVGAAGFEPATLCPQSRCAASLRHAPKPPKPIPPCAVRGYMAAGARAATPPSSA